MFYEMFQKENYVIRVQSGAWAKNFFTLGVEVLDKKVSKK